MHFHSSPFHYALDGTALGCSFTFRWCCCFPFSWWQNNCQSSAQDNVGVRYIECLYSSYLDQSTDSLWILFFVLLLSMAVSSITLYTLPLAFMLNRTSFFFSFYLLIVQITAFHASSTCLTIFWAYMSFSTLLGNMVAISTDWMIFNFALSSVGGSKTTKKKWPKQNV